MKTHTVRALALPLLAGCALWSCEKSAPAPVAPADAPVATPLAAAPADAAGDKSAGAEAGSGNVALAEAKSIMAQRCTLCHGLEGRGNGPAAANLNPKPANYTDPKWQASVDDDTLRKAIVGGGPSVGKSMMMPANPDLQDKPQVVDELVKLIRGFKK